MISLLLKLTAPFPGILFRMTGISLSFGPPDGAFIFAQPDTMKYPAVIKTRPRIMTVSHQSFSIKVTNLHFLKIIKIPEELEVNMLHLKR